MIEVILYSREDCHLCDQAKIVLEELQSVVPHHLQIIDVDSDKKLVREFGFNVPVIEVGPYRIKAPIEKQDLEITLKAAQHRAEQLAKLEREVEEKQLSIKVNWTKMDGFGLWLARHYLAVFNLIIFVYLGGAFLAPMLMKVGATTPAEWIYKVYGAACHQLAYRSWFLFGEQYIYPRASAGIDGLLSYGEATQLDENNLWDARNLHGNETLGYKVALCERDVAIYLGILFFGIFYSVTKRRWKSLHWIAWIAIGLLPIGLDGLSQLVSQPPLSILPYRESTPLLRTLTGFLFGYLTAWFGYPYVEESMVENHKYLEGKNKIYQKQKELGI